MKVKNPIDPQNGTVTFVENFKAEEIVNCYIKMGLKVNRFFPEENIQLYKCDQTGYRFYYPFNAIGDAKFYEDLSISRKNYYSERWEHSRALRFIEKNENVLEVGTGFGAFLNLLKIKGIKANGLELNGVAVKNCRDQGLNVENKLIQDDALENSGQYDVVCYFQVLEHITDVGSFLKASVDLLKVGGRLMIGVPNNNPYLFINDRMHTLNLPPHHAGLWNKNSLENLQKIFPLKKIHLEFEPLEEAYSEFIEQWTTNQKNKFIKKAIIVMRAKAPKILKKFCCKFINGRNIFVVFEKIS